jgi:hypothetical protein
VGALQKKRGDSSTRAEAAKLTNTLLEASKSAPKITGKIVNDYGQEEVLVFSDCSRPRYASFDVQMFGNSIVFCTDC